MEELGSAVWGSSAVCRLVGRSYGALKPAMLTGTQAVKAQLVWFQKRTRAVLGTSVKAVHGTC